jgi:hypothetical protein
VGGRGLRAWLQQRRAARRVAPPRGVPLALHVHFSGDPVGR